MFRTLRRLPARRVGRPNRVFLRLEDLEGRAHPSGLTDPLTPPVTSPSDQSATNQPPAFVDFTAEEGGGGVFLFSGWVRDENPAGLVVKFGGTVGSVQGLTAICDETGYFQLRVTLKTDGSDDGSVTVSVTDGGGLTAEDLLYVHPTSP